MTKKKCVIYTRVSTVVQTKNKSLGSQKEACEGYAKRNGYEVDKIFEEEGESAKTANRTKFQEMFVYLKESKEKISAVIVWKLDRFSRDALDSLLYHKMLKSWNIKLISLTENIDETPVGKFTSTMLAGISQFDNEIRAERTTVGMTQAVKNGQWISKAPFGYDLEDKKLVVNERKSILLKELFNQYIQNQSLKECGRFLKKKGIVRSSKVISKMLKNKVYIGLIECKLLDSPVKGNHEPIVAEEIFEKVQKILSNNHGSKKTTRRQKFDPRLYLRGLLYCDKCGSRLTGSMSRGKNKSYLYYRCLKNCINRGASKLHTLIDDLLDEYTFDSRVISMFENTLKKTYKDMDKQNAKETQILKQQITKLKTQKDKVLDMRINEELDEKMYKNKIEQINSELHFKNNTLMILKEKMIDIDKLFDKIKILLKNPKKLLNTLQPLDRQRVMFVLFPEGIKVVGETYRTPITSPILRYLQNISGSEKKMVVPRGIEPLLPE